MAGKKIFQDMVVGAPRRSIRDITRESEIRREKKAAASAEASSVSPASPRVSSEPKHTRKMHSANGAGGLNTPRRGSARSKNVLVFAIAIVAMVVIVAATSLFFSKGTVIVKQRVETVRINAPLIAKEDAKSPDLGYQVVTVTDESRSTVPGVAGAPINQKAKGTVTLYNTTSVAQKLIANTRVSNAKGLVYRIASAVTIPAARTKPSLVAGSVDVAVIADQAGAEYNTKLADLTGDFKVVAYKGTPKYTTVYARAKTDIIGGFIGRQIVAEKKASTAAEVSAQQSLTSSLVTKAKALVPPGYVLYDTAGMISFSSSTVATGTSADLIVKATYTGYILKIDTLARSVAKDQIAQFPADEYTLADVESLTFKTSPTTLANASKTKTLPFSIAGTIRIIGRIPTERLATELAGVSIESSKEIIKHYSTIVNAHARIFPVWMRSLPDSPSRINIEVEQ